MRIVIDLQGCQSDSRFRGIGRYSMSFANAILRNRGEHEVILVLNGLIPDTIQSIRDHLGNLLAPEDIRVWHAPGPVSGIQSENAGLREQAEYIREAFIASLQPDLIHVASLFEGFGDDAVVSIGSFERSVPVSVSFYDLIPFRNPDQYLKSNWNYEIFYLKKLESLLRADLYLSISEFAKSEAIRHLGLAETKVINVSSAVESSFAIGRADKTILQSLRHRIRLSRPFVLYTGGADSRKNLFRLIEAFSLLPNEVRLKHQLVLAGHIPEGNALALKSHAQSLGLNGDDLLFAGYVSEEELVNLYYDCKLYVFPSLDEGFGLPALEAMSCGTPVIGANTTSIPEVIQWEEALFDPYDTSAISRKILYALVDNVFRARLIENGLSRASMFSWDKTAKRAIAAWENLSSIRKVFQPTTSYGNIRSLEAIRALRNDPSQQKWNDLANCLSKNRHAGIERQLLIDVSEFCHQDAATGVQRVVKNYLGRLLTKPPAGFRVEPVYATVETEYKYARNFKNRFLGLHEQSINDEPVMYGRGDIFFGLDLQHHVQLANAEYFKRIRSQGVIVKFLVYDLLPIQLPQFFDNSELQRLHQQLLSMIASTDGAICISRATESALKTWLSENNIKTAANFRTSCVHIGADIEISRPSTRKISENNEVIAQLHLRPTFICVSTLEPRKGQQQVLEAFDLLWSRNVDVNLLLVGKQGWKIEALAEQIRSHKEFGDRLIWLEGISDEYLGAVYEASTCLIAASHNEGFGLSLIEAVHFGKPVIARDIPVFREVVGGHAHYFHGFSGIDLAESVISWLAIPNKHLSNNVFTSPCLTWEESTEKLKQELIQQNYPHRQILVDISELVQRDAKTGIQRVVNNVLKEWLENPPEDYRIEPVYATLNEGYRYAKEFSHRFTGEKVEFLPDELIDFAPGDIFVGLDFQPQIVYSHRGFYKTLMQQGVSVHFVVYDLLSITMPNNFAYGTDKYFKQWLEVIVACDGVACISNSVLKDFKHWIKTSGIRYKKGFSFKSFLLGSNIINRNEESQISASITKLINNFKSRLTFLMVGTLEPRKGHEQVLFAFEQLWKSGQNVNLVLVGKQGWKVDALTNHIRNHSELNMRLFWLDAIDDESLGKIYDHSSCLIAASSGEGFGLPLVEAAKHELAIIARELPIFKEVCEGNAYYFSGNKPDDLATAIEKWIDLYNQDKHPASKKIEKISWYNSAKHLLSILMN